MGCALNDTCPQTQTEQEKELNEAAKLLVYVCEKASVKPKKWMIDQAEHYSGNYHFGDSVGALCEMLKAMSPKKRESLLYNAHDRDARDLANWWEDHLKQDAIRDAREAERNKTEAVKAKTLSKLTSEERKALGFK